MGAAAQDWKSLSATEKMDAALWYRALGMSALSASRLYENCTRNSIISCWNRALARGETTYLVIPRSKRPESFTIRLPRALMPAFFAAAESRGLSTAELLQKLVTVIGEDGAGLINAILDDDAEAA